MIPLLLACAVHDLRAIDLGVAVTLPDDHAPHDDAQTEWWHVHAELQDVQTGEPLHVFAGFVAERTDLDSVAFVPVPVSANCAMSRSERCTQCAHQTSPASQPSRSRYSTGEQPWSSRQ